MQFIEVLGPELLLAQAQLLEVFPGEQAAVVAVVEGQFQCVLAGGFDLAQADADLAKLQDGFACLLYTSPSPRDS